MRLSISPGESPWLPSNSQRGCIGFCQLFGASVIWNLNAKGKRREADASVKSGEGGMGCGWDRRRGLRNTSVE